MLDGIAYATALGKRVEDVKAETKAALQTLYDNLVPGQKKKIAKAPEVKALLDRYGVDYGEE